MSTLLLGRSVLHDVTTTLFPNSKWNLLYNLLFSLQLWFKSLEQIELNAGIDGFKNITLPIICNALSQRCSVPSLRALWFKCLHMVVERESLWAHARHNSWKVKPLLRSNILYPMSHYADWDSQNTDCSKHWLEEHHISLLQCKSSNKDICRGRAKQL